MKYKEFLNTVSKDLAKTKRNIEIVSLGDPDVASTVKCRIPTSSKILNRVIGGGIPCGRITEIFGEEGNGKSTLGADIMLNCQRMGGLAVVLDSERAFDREHFAKFGLDPEKTFYTPEVSIETSFTIIDSMLSNAESLNAPMVIVWDSIAQSPADAELEGQFLENHRMAERARNIYSGLRRVTGKIGSNVALVLINQVRSNMNATWGKKTQSVGGYSIKFSTSLRIELEKVGFIKQDEKVLGIKCQANVVKCKVAQPYKRCHFDLYFSGLIDESQYLLDALENLELVKQSGAWYAIGDKKFYAKQFREILQELPNKEELIEKALSLYD